MLFRCWSKGVGRQCDAQPSAGLTARGIGNDLTADAENTGVKPTEKGRRGERTSYVAVQNSLASLLAALPGVGSAGS